MLCLPHLDLPIVGIFAGHNPASKLKKKNIQACLISSFKIIYPVSIHLHFYLGLFTSLSFYMSSFPVSTLSVCLSSSKIVSVKFWIVIKNKDSALYCLACSMRPQFPTILKLLIYSCLWAQPILAFRDFFCPAIW